MKGTFVGFGFRYLIAAVYALNNEIRKRDLWQFLRDWRATHPGPWCVLADFNEILSQEAVVVHCCMVDFA